MSWLLIAAFFFAYGSMTALCVSTERQFAELAGRGREASSRLRGGLRLLAAAGLGLSWYACVQVEGGSHGLLCWFGYMTVAALIVTVIWSYAPRLAATFGYLAWGLAVLGAAIAVIAR